MKRKYLKIKENLQSEAKNGNQRDVILNLFSQLEDILQSMYGKNARTIESVRLAFRDGYITKEDANSLNMLRIARNNIVHGVNNTNHYARDTIGKWIDIVYSL